MLNNAKYDCWLNGFHSLGSGFNHLLTICCDKCKCWVELTCHPGILALTCTAISYSVDLRQNPIGDRAISVFSGQNPGKRMILGILQ